MLRDVFAVIYPPAICQSWLYFQDVTDI